VPQTSESPKPQHEVLQFSFLSNGFVVLACSHESQTGRGVLSVIERTREGYSSCKPRMKP
jgi:hypothetical protein